MKTLYLQCGLGNQMFQFAYLRYLQSLGVNDVAVDTSAPSLRHHTKNSIHTIFPAIASSSVRFLPYWVGRTRHLWSDFLKKGLHINTETEAWEGTFERGKCWLRGYWQVAYPAEKCREQILTDYTFPPLEDRTNIDMASKIGNCSGSVLLHIRRGDYFADNAAVSTFGSCVDERYYSSAIDYIDQHTPSPHYFIFSDDARWVRDNFLSAHPSMSDHCTVVDHNKGEASFRDMQLMSLCRHAIISNSTFSWWGAFLSRVEASERIVIAPKGWLAGIEETRKGGICPESWVLL